MRFSAEWKLRKEEKCVTGSLWWEKNQALKHNQSFLRRSSRDQLQESSDLINENKKTLLLFFYVFQILITFKTDKMFPPSKHEKSFSDVPQLCKTLPNDESSKLFYSHKWF